MTARSTFSPARKVRSTTAPLRAFLSVVRTKAPPLPGFTCWNSTTLKRPSSRARVIPFLRSLVVIDAIRFPGVRFLGSGGERRFLGGQGERPAPVFGDDHGVLDPHAAVPRQVHTALDGDHVAGLEGT